MPAPATLAATAVDWAAFAAWCRARGIVSLPAAPATVAAYLAALASSHAGSMLRRRVAAIGRTHRMRGLAWEARHPALRDSLAGILRQHDRPPRRASALGTAEIRLRGAAESGGGHSARPDGR